MYVHIILYTYAYVRLHVNMDTYLPKSRNTSVITLHKKGGNCLERPLLPSRPDHHHDHLHLDCDVDGEHDDHHDYEDLNLDGFDFLR